MNIPLRFVCIFSCILLSNAVVKYQNYAMGTFTPTTDEQHNMLKELQKNEAVIFMSPLANKNVPTQVAFAPHVQGDMMQFYLDNIKSEIVTNNLETMINREAMAEAEQIEIEAVLGEEQKYTENSFARYWTLAEYYKFCDTMAKTFPNITKKISYGKSVNGNDLMALEINKGGTPKPVVFMDACTHAREWITPITVSYLIFQLLTNPNYATLLDIFAFSMAPMVNPDGYDFSWTTDRMWRKNRGRNSGTSCVGTDPNRNYAHAFGGEGSSNNPCDETYHGKAPFSCPEAKFMSEYLSSTNNVILYMSYHSYSQLLLLPYGNDVVPYPAAEKARDMQVATAGCKALQSVNGETYKAGSTNEMLYAASGVGTDWAKANECCKICYTWELRDTGNNGFLLPANQIIPTCREITVATKAMCETIAVLEKL